MKKLVLSLSAVLMLAITVFLVKSVHTSQAILASVAYASSYEDTQKDLPSTQPEITSPVHNIPSTTNHPDEITDVQEIVPVTIESEVIEVVTPVYDGKSGCQIWLTRDTVAIDCETNEEISIGKGEKLTITEDSSDTMLRCQYSGKDYLVDSTYALINIAQYIPEIQINLDMAKSENLFTINDENIPGLTDHQFYTSESALSGDAWLLIGAADNLAKAQEQFLSDGYCIRIYDAFRPYTCSQAIGSIFKEFVDNKPQSFRDKCFGGFGIGWFLAQKPSNHNFGIAVDMTLVDLETGEELEMPATMHNLDKRSARDFWEKGTPGYDNADYMAKVMKASGFSDLKSEWWHFQDNNVTRPSDVIVLDF